jgi:outer membrane protein OmpA-like peptidoglycan-associated protein
MFQPDANWELGELVICQELMGLGIEGTFAYDGSTDKLYFSKKGKKGKKGKKNELYEATFNGKKWAKIKKLKINGVGATNMEREKGSSLPAARWAYKKGAATGFYNPTMSKKGQRIYFSGTFKAGKGDRDIWYIDKEAKKWSFPESAGDGVNTEFREDYAFLVGDTALFFASSRDGGKGNLDLYVAYRDGKSWGAAQPLKEMSSNADDYNVVFMQGLPFFISDRSGGKGKADIYRPVPTPPKVVDELMSDFTLTEPKEFHWVLFYFDFDMAVLKREYAVQLDELASAMKEFPEANFQVNGHTDIRGADLYNMELSERRAEYVKKMLTDRSVTADKMIVLPHGKRQMAIPNANNEAEHEQNRRVEVKIVNKK